MIRVMKSLVKIRKIGEDYQAVLYIQGYQTMINGTCCDFIPLGIVKAEDIQAFCSTVGSGGHDVEFIKDDLGNVSKGSS